ncbi:tape measure protein [uncultured Cohaesibacter sp.]|uniref:tape measure protein n=1 Tax=uncultured Cohaesibacter sp. TaxID=1002546 RepID=UPI002AAB241C|nr:tape measure protein [uncultured Cohaesibacter sp.]
MTMRLGIVADFTDRASKRMAKLLRANQKLDKANKAQGKLAKSQAGQTKAQAAAQGKFASQVERSNRLMASLKATSAALGGTISSAIAAMGRFTGSISTAIRKVFSLKQALARIRNGAGMMKSGFGKVARGALVAGGLGLGAAGAAAGAANMVIGPAAQVETYMVQLEALEKSSAKAKQAMGWITDFAAKTPLELPEVIEAYRQLKVYGIDPTNGSMRALVDTMAMSGGGAETLQGIIMAVGQAWTKGKLQTEEINQMVERGIPVWDMLSKATGKSAAQLQKLASAGELGKDVISKLVDLMADRASGASEKMSRTWNGMLSNMSDHWFQFRLLIAQSGVFDWAKEKLQGFLDTLNRMKADGSLKAFAEQISSNIIASLQTIWSFGQELWSVLQQVGNWLKTAADALGGWNRLVGVFIALPLLGTIASIITGFAQLAGGLVLVGSGIAALSLPVVAVVAGVAAVAAAAYLIYENWDGIADWFGNLWDQIVNLASGAWDWFKSNLSWHPLAMIANNWGVISDWFASFWPGIQNLAQAGWDGLKSLFAWTPLGLIINNWSALTDWFASFWPNIQSLAQTGWNGLKSLFGWTPLGLVISNWSSLTDWFSSFWNNLSESIQAGWTKVKGLFDVGVDFSWPELPDFPSFDLPDLNALIEGLNLDTLKASIASFSWPELPELSLPNLSSLMDEVRAFFSLDWLPDWTWPKIPMPELPDLEGMIDGMVDKAGAAWNRVRSLFADDDPVTIAARDPASIERATAAAQDLKEALDQVATADVSPALTRLDAVQAKAQVLPTIVQAAVDTIANLLASVDFTYQGQRMMETIAAGMRSRASILVNEMRNVTQQLRDHLPSSPAKVGPLSDIHRLKFGETIARSIKPEPMVRAMRNAAAATLAAATIGSPAVAMPQMATAPLAQTAAPRVPNIVAVPKAPVIPPAVETQALSASVPQAMTPTVSAMQASGNSSGAPNTQSGATYHIQFTPQISIGEGSSLSREDIEDILRDNIDELMDLLERRKDEDGRLDF